MLSQIPYEMNIFTHQEISFRFFFYSNWVNKYLLSTFVPGTVLGAGNTDIVPGLLELTVS